MTRTNPLWPKHSQLPMVHQYIWPRTTCYPKTTTRRYKAIKKLLLKGLGHILNHNLSTHKNILAIIRSLFPQSQTSWCPSPSLYCNYYMSIEKTQEPSSLCKAKSILRPAFNPYGLTTSLSLLHANSTPHSLSHNYPAATFRGNSGFSSQSKIIYIGVERAILQRG